MSWTTSQMPPATALAEAALDLHRVVNNNLLPKRSTGFDEFLVNRMILVDFMPRQIIEEYKLRSAVTCLHYISLCGIGGEPRGELADSFYLSQSSKTLQQLGQILF